MLTEPGRKALKSSPDIVQERLIGALTAMKPARRKSLANLLNELIEAAGFAGEPATLFFESDPDSKRKKTKSGI